MDGRAEGHGQVYQSGRDQHIVHHYGPTEPVDRAAGPDSVRHPAVGRVPVRLRDRVELMESLRGILDPGTGSLVYVLHGLGGAGKTAVAHTVFRAAVTEGGRVGLWVNASDAASLRAGMLAVAADRGAQDVELAAARSGLRAAADLVWEYLDDSDRPWLLVLDNADDPGVLRDGGWLRTSRRGVVLVTTRQAAAHWWSGAELHHIGVLPRAAAAQVLCDLAPETGSIEEATAIAERLGRLPLALTLAGGFLANQIISPWTMADYQQGLDGGGEVDSVELIDRGAEVGHDSRHLVSRTWLLSLDVLTDQGLPEAVTLLRLLTCWSSDPLPVSLLAGADLGAELPAARSDQALRGLLDQSLTDLVPGPGTSRCLRTHGVLLDSVARSVPVPQRDPLAALAARLLAAALPETPQRGDQDDRLTLLVPHTLALLQRQADWTSVELPTVEAGVRCALRLVVALHRAGDYPAALSLASDAAALAKRRLEERHPLVIGLGQRIGRAQCRLGRPEGAEALDRTLLQSCEQVFGPTDLITLESCLVLALSLWPLGRAPEAAELARRCVTGRTDLLGPAHPLTLIARTVLLQITADAEPGDGITEGPALVADCVRTLGSDHPITVSAELDYAFVLFSSGEPTRALPVARTALAGHEHCFGPRYPTTLAARSLLARVLAGSGQRAEAAEQMAAVLDGRARALGADHPWTLTARRRLGEYRGEEGERGGD